MSWIDWITGKRPTPPQPVSSATVSVLDIVNTVVPAPPALKQEQFADTHATIAAQEARIRTVYRQVVAVNNSHVTRNEGDATRDYTRALPAQDETALRELPATAAELKQLQIDVVLQPKSEPPRYYQPE